MSTKTHDHSSSHVHGARTSATSRNAQKEDVKGQVVHPEKQIAPPGQRVGIWYGVAMLSCGLIASALAWLFLAPSSVSAKPGTIQLGRTIYEGNTSSSHVTVYYGIPYAQAPIGDLRWRAPRPLTSSIFAPTRIIDAASPPLPCIQGTTGGGDAGGAGSEDCLKVNVYAPANATTRSSCQCPSLHTPFLRSPGPVPVLTYIHGGGYTYGNPINWPFTHWVEQDPNVVVVSVYYRLAAIGFLATPELANPAVGDLNVGFLDQIEALRWIQKNIRAFGGDPTRVTINGESAGMPYRRWAVLRPQSYRWIIRRAASGSKGRTALVPRGHRAERLQAHACDA